MSAESSRISVSGSQLASLLLVCSVRVSQWRNRGYLDGCWHGPDSARRYDLELSLLSLKMHLCGPLSARTQSQIDRVLATLLRPSPPTQQFHRGIE